MQQVYSPYQQYQRQKNIEVETADRVKLISMLLEGAICFNKKALVCLECDDHVKTMEFAVRGQKIVMHLYECLDFDNEGAEIAKQLGRLYSYCGDEYAKFLKGDKVASRLESINEVLGTLLEGWKQIEGQAT